MKKTLVALFAFTVMFTSIHAQIADSLKTRAKKTHTAAWIAKKQAKKDSIAAAKTANVTAAKTQAQSAVTQRTNAATSTVQQAANTTRKAVGTTKTGKTIYEGSKGGHYTLSASGKREYIKRAKDSTSL
jgi:hypothetical protein